MRDYIREQGLVIDSAETPAADSLILLATYGEDTTTAALRFDVDATRAISIDMLTDLPSTVPSCLRLQLKSLYRPGTRIVC